MYIGLVRREGTGMRAIMEFKTVSTDRMDAAIDQFSFQLDGYDTQLIEFNTVTNKARNDEWNRDPIFFSMVKSQFITRRNAEAEAKKPKLALRPDDV